MIRLTGLISLPAIGLSSRAPRNDSPIPAEQLQESPVPETPEEPIQEPSVEQNQSIKANLMTLSKQVNELYNMIGDDEQLEPWVSERLSQACEHISAIHSQVQYEKSKAQSIGNGEGSPADATLTRENSEEVCENCGDMPEKEKDSEEKSEEEITN